MVAMVCLFANASRAESDSPAAPLENWEYRWSNSPAAESGDLDWKSLSRWGRWTERQSRRELWLRVQLPDKLQQNSSLFLEKLPAGLEIYLDGKRILIAGVFEDSENFWFRDTGKHRIVKLFPDAAGKTLIFRVWDRNGLNVALSQPTLGMPEQLVLEHFRSNTAYGMLGILFMFGGITCILLAAFLPQRKSWLFLGLLALSFGWISLDRIGIFTLTVDWPYIRTLGTQLALFSFGIWLTAALAELIAVPDLAAWMWRLCYAHIVGFVVTGVLYLAKIVHPDEMLLYGLPLQIASLVVCGVILLAAWRRASRGAMTLLIGVVPLGICIIGGAIASLLFSESNLSRALPVGLAFFLTALAVQLVRRTLGAFEAQVAGAALKHSEARFRALTDNATDMVFLLDSAGRYLFASPSCFAGTGLKQADLYGSRLFDRIHAEDVADVRRRFQELVDNPGTTVVLEYRHRHADGSWSIHEARAANHLREFDVAGLVFNVRDVTQRRRNEEHLRESEARLRAIVGAIPLDSWALDQNGRYIPAPQLSKTLTEWRGSGLVLIVDEDDMVRTVARRFFEQAGFTVQLAEGGQQAIEFVREHGRDVRLILLDMNIPGLSSEETVRELRRLGSASKLLITGGYREEEAADRFAGLEVAGYIRKPWHSQQLMAKVCELLK
jgi:PAS domain S-box-containing protein